MGRKTAKRHAGFSEDSHAGDISGGAVKPHKSSKDQETSASQQSFVRKQIEPETAKYFAEISNVIEGTEIELEERSVICGSALEETRGKEVELATDYIISHTLQTLLEGCSLEHLCGFLRCCADDFAYIAMDRSGSHVAETALKSLAVHLQDRETHSLVENTLTKICQAIVINPVDVMCNCYGSHVLRSLLSLLKGVPIEEFHATKSSMVLAARFNFKSPQMVDNYQLQERFPSLLNYLVSEMLDASRKDMGILQVNQYSSLVLQAALKLFSGKDELMHIIPILLGCRNENATENCLIEGRTVKNLLRLMEETAFSRLMEVILEVAPETLYNELLTKLFKNSLLLMSSHHCGNFVVQALVSCAKSKDHMELIWEELGTKFKDLFEMGRSGVVASLLAASQRLQCHEHKCCQALATAVCTENDSSRCIVPRILFLDNFFSYEDKSSWNWPSGVKMQVIGSLILQTVFSFPIEFVQAYTTSITSLEDNHVLEASKDPSGSRAIEAFLTSDVSAKLKRKLVSKLRGHFGELSMHPIGTFTVDKCFNCSNMSLREAIVSEMLPLQTELSKTKQGPYLLRKLDVDGFAKRPDQWRSKQTSRESTYKEFYAEFGTSETKTSSNKGFLSDDYLKSQPEKVTVLRKEIEISLASAGSNKFRKSSLKRSSDSVGFIKDDMRGKSKNRKKSNF